ncbi:MAG: hypothetical protein ACI8PB_000855 [Desulforhopalus sp.]|jgi:hypothetical protein
MWYAACFIPSIRLGSINLKLSLEMESIMKTRTAITKSGVSNPSKTRTDTNTTIDNTILTVVGLFASAIGLWAFACIIGGMIAAGGPFSLVAGWFKAVSGL